MNKLENTITIMIVSCGKILSLDGPKYNDSNRLHCIESS